MLGAEPTALPLRAPGWTCSTSCHRRGLSCASGPSRALARDRPSGWPSRRGALGRLMGMDLRDRPQMQPRLSARPAAPCSSERMERRTRSTALDPDEERSSDRFGEGARPAAKEREEEGLRTGFHATAPTALVGSSRGLWTEAASRERLTAPLEAARSSDRAHREMKPWLRKGAGQAFGSGRRAGLRAGPGRAFESNRGRTFASDRGGTFGARPATTRSRRAQPTRSANLRERERRRTSSFARTIRRDLRVEPERPSGDGDGADRLESSGSSGTSLRPGGEDLRVRAVRADGSRSQTFGSGSGCARLRRLRHGLRTGARKLPPWRERGPAASCFGSERASRSLGGASGIRKPSGFRHLEPSSPRSDGALRSIEAERARKLPERAGLRTRELRESTKRHRREAFGPRAGQPAPSGAGDGEDTDRKVPSDPTDHVVPERLRPRRLPAKPEG
jgi:hypothetical protein